MILLVDKKIQFIKMEVQKWRQMLAKKRKNRCLPLFHTPSD